MTSTKSVRRNTKTVGFSPEEWEQIKAKATKAGRIPREHILKKLGIT